MSKNRMEAFSDGVLAIILTIMVLELKVPHGTTLTSLAPLVPVFLSYVLSFVFVGIYWNNHHHLLHLVKHVDGRILWANLHLLFWLSLIPFTTGWMGENSLEALPVAAYGGVLLFSGAAYFLLTRALLAQGVGNASLAQALVSTKKEKVSVLVYAAAIGLAFLSPWIAIGLYVGVALWWLVPDRRIERLG